MKNSPVKKDNQPLTSIFSEIWARLCKLQWCNLRFKSKLYKWVSQLKQIKHTQYSDLY